MNRRPSPVCLSNSRVRRGTAATLALALWSCAAPLCAADAPLPAAAFVRRGEFAYPTLSPDGQHLVLSRLVRGDGPDAAVIRIIDLTRMAVVNDFQMPQFEIPAGFWWLTNSRIAVATARTFGTVDRPLTTGEVQAMDIDGKRQEYLYGYKPGNVRGATVKRRGVVVTADYGSGRVKAVSAALNGHFLLTENPWSWKISRERSVLWDIDSVSTSRHQMAAIDKEDFDFIFGSDGKARYAYGDGIDSEPAVYEYVDETTWRSVLGPDKPGFRPLALSPDDREVYALMFRKAGGGALVRRALPEGDPVVLVEDRVGEIDTIEWGPRPRTPFAATTGVGIPQLRYFAEDRPEAALHKAMSAQFPGGYVHFFNFSDDGKKLLFSVSSDRDPGALYLFDRETNKALFVYADSPAIDPAKMPPRRPIHFTAGDGLELHGYLTLPTAAGDAKPPLILVPHGGPHGVSDEWFYDADAAFLASRGYAVLQVNYRGSGGRGPGFERSGYRQWGARVQQDLLDGVRWAVAQGGVDASRICAYGASFGAYSAMMVAIRAPELFKCAVGYAGVYDLAKMYESEEVVESKQVFNYWVKVVGRDPAELAQNSPVQLAEKLKVPVLLAHGGSDWRAPPEQAKAMREALTKVGRAPEWMFVDGEGHGFYVEKNRIAFYEKLEAFLGKYLGK